MAKIKRSLLKTFVNTTPSTTATYTLLSTGVTKGKIEMGPKLTEEVYIDVDSGSVSVDSYAPQMPIEGTVVNGEALFEKLDALRKGRSVLSDAETDVLNVYLFKGVADGKYFAEKQNVAISIEKIGGPGGEAAKLNYTINYLGGSVFGLYDPVANTFTESKAAAFLLSLVIASVRLSPQFKAKRIWYKAATDDATNTITVTGPATASFDIDVDGVTVENGAAATWTEGLNVVTITCTVGASVATYIILVTYTPGA
jgi:hypothetical protein